MSSPSFKFKQFEIFHDQCAMKVGTDGVLLGAWVARQYADMKPTRILDVGCGSGLIAIMLAQQFSSASITAIDIDPQAIEQAKQNISLCPWSNRIEAQLADYASLAATTPYDLIVCNPPFFSHSLKNPDSQRAIARHNDSLPFDVLIKHTLSNMLTSDGIFSIIVPASEIYTIIDLASPYSISEICNVRTYPNKPYKRVILSLSHNKKETRVSELTLENLDHTRSPQYRALTDDYYFY